MATNPHDPRPQAKINNVKGANTAEPRGAYVDPLFTVRNPPDTDVPVSPPKTQANDLGNIRRYYSDDKVDEIAQTATNPGVDPAPHSLPKWEIETTGDGISRGKDPYREDGMISQNAVLKNQG